MKAFFPFSLYLFSFWGAVSLPGDSLAQGIDSGAWSLSTNLEVWHRNLQENYTRKTLHYTANLQANYFIDKNLSAGIGIKRDEQGYKTLPDSLSHVYSSIREVNTIFIHVRKYWFVTKSVGLYVQTGYGYGIGKLNYTGPASNNTTWLNEHEIGIKPGLIVFPLKRFALEMNLGNLAIKRSAWRRQFETEDQSEITYVFNLAPTLNLGIHYFISER